MSAEEEKGNKKERKDKRSSNIITREELVAET